ncbi:MAG TPA: hypothetical protein VGG69_00220, partial [Rhizomicrobium sp.]
MNLRDDTLWKAELLAMGAVAREAARSLRETTSASKTVALMAAASALRANANAILAANATDIDAARTNSLGAAMLDRLSLNPQRIEA